MAWDAGCRGRGESMSKCLKFNWKFRPCLEHPEQHTAIGKEENAKWGSGA